MKAIINGSDRDNSSEVQKVQDFLISKSVNLVDFEKPEATSIVSSSSKSVTLKDIIFAKIKGCKWMVIANSHNKISNSRKLEMAYAISLGIKLFSIKPIADPKLSIYIQPLTDLFPDWCSA